MPKLRSLLVLTLLATPAAAQTPAAQVEFVGHRGASFDAPENTLAAFRMAWARGAKAIELDVHPTKDGSLIVSHDANTKRTTGVSRLIHESTMADLRQLDAGGWKGEYWKGERLPTLEEALATIPEGGRCFIEVKVGAEAIPAVAKAIQESGKRRDQFVIISFQLDAVAAAKQQLPDIEAYYLASFKQDASTGRWSPSIDELIRQAQSTKADGLDLAYRGPLSSETVAKIRSAGLGLYVWTVDSPEVARQMIALGVDGITSNRPVALEREVSGR